MISSSKKWAFTSTKHLLPVLRSSLLLHLFLIIIKEIKEIERRRGRGIKSNMKGDVRTLGYEEQEGSEEKECCRGGGEERTKLT